MTTPPRIQPDRLTPATAVRVHMNDEDDGYLCQWLEAENRSFWIPAEIVRLREAAHAAVAKARYSDLA